MAEALQGIVVLDLTAYLAGPYGCAILGDVGAEVIKIEPPRGDALRQYPSSLTDECRTFLGANRNKRSIVLDLKSADGQAAFYRLVERADVVVHNFRPLCPPAWNRLRDTSRPTARSHLLLADRLRRKRRRSSSGSSGLRYDAAVLHWLSLDAGERFRAAANIARFDRRLSYRLICRHRNFVSTRPSFADRRRTACKAISVKVCHFIAGWPVHMGGRRASRR